jgi:hypothetical protein
VTDYSAQIDDLKAAAAICERHTITTAVNGANSSYPRWPTAWEACEVVWRNYLDMKSMEGDSAEVDRETVVIEAGKLR